MTSFDQNKIIDFNAELMEKIFQRFEKYKARIFY